jgi:hypothetical protein
MLGTLAAVALARMGVIAPPGAGEEFLREKLSELRQFGGKSRATRNWPSLAVMHRKAAEQSEYLRRCNLPGLAPMQVSYDAKTPHQLKRAHRWIRSGRTPEQAPTHIRAALLTLAKVNPEGMRATAAEAGVR